MGTVRNRDVRTGICAITRTAIPPRVFYGVIDETAAPWWAAIVGSVTAPTRALANLTPVAPESREVRHRGLIVAEDVTWDVEGSS